MATIYNSDLSKELIKAAKIATARDNIPNQLAEKVVPVMEVNPFLVKTSQIVRSTSAQNAAAGTIYTTPTNQDFYLTSITLTMIKDATATSTRSAVTATIDGASTGLVAIQGFTLTAQDQSITINYTRPIKIDRGTSLFVTNTTAVANISAVAYITGFIDEASNA